MAITILVVIATISWRGLDALTHARDTLSRQTEDARLIQLTFAQLQSDCANTIDPAVLPGRAPIVVTANGLVLVRYAPTDGQPLRLKIVAYHLINGTLFRRESAATRNLDVLDAAWPLASSSLAAAQDVPLQWNVAAMRIRTWQGATQGWRTPGIDIVSEDSGNLATASLFPTGIEVSLRLARSPGQITKVFLIGNP